MTLQSCTRFLEYPARCRIYENKHFIGILIGRKFTGNKTKPTILTFINFTKTSTKFEMGFAAINALYLCFFQFFFTSFFRSQISG